MIVLRSHYSIDMIAGIIVAHYFWIMSEKYSYYVDWHIFKTPLAKRMAKELPLSEEELK